ncbi:hypothetical protein D9611_000709 [Ephemerocybe angulata]|uniref:Uncharacterized protein n=1 Tax=Ephemerocybe angulata TaxID=980116 RepID=A0A8H5BNE0_9AGAR|nr:hypothetical protein D9611_000709 [Tulosesus angulatus]
MGHRFSTLAPRVQQGNRYLSPSSEHEDDETLSSLSTDIAEDPNATLPDLDGVVDSFQNTPASTTSTLVEVEDLVGKAFGDEEEDIDSFSTSSASSGDFSDSDGNLDDFLSFSRVGVDDNSERVTVEDENVENVEDGNSVAEDHAIPVPEGNDTSAGDTSSSSSNDDVRLVHLQKYLGRGLTLVWRSAAGRRGSGPDNEPRDDDAGGSGDETNEEDVGSDELTDYDATDSDDNTVARQDASESDDSSYSLGLRPDAHLADSGINISRDERGYGVPDAEYADEETVSSDDTDSSGPGNSYSSEAVRNYDRAYFNDWESSEEENYEDGPENFGSHTTSDRSRSSNSPSGSQHDSAYKSANPPPEYYSNDEDSDTESWGLPSDSINNANNLTRSSAPSTRTTDLATLLEEKANSKCSEGWCNYTCCRPKDRTQPMEAHCYTPCDCPYPHHDMHDAPPPAYYS